MAKGGAWRRGVGMVKGGVHGERGACMAKGGVRTHPAGMHSCLVLDLKCWRPPISFNYSMKVIIKFQITRE